MNKQLDRMFALLISERNGCVCRQATMLRQKSTEKDFIELSPMMSNKNNLGGLRGSINLLCRHDGIRFKVQGGEIIFCAFFPSNQLNGTI